MYPGIHNFSEIGKLNKVLLHKPGLELEALTPTTMERLLFDDIPFLKIAQEEHDIFTKILEDNGVEVIFYVDETAKALADAKIRTQFINEFLDLSDVKAAGLRESIIEFLMSMEPDKMVAKLIAGVKKTDLRHHEEVTSLYDIIENDYPFVSDPMPNLYFTRDPFAVVGTGVNLNRMYSVTRNRETLYGKYIFKYHPDYKDVSLYFRRDASFHTEGGDVLNINEHTIAVGISQRTQAAAIDVMAQNMFWNSDSKIDTILAFDIPVSRAFMHLDTVFTQIDVDKFTIHPAIMGTLKVYKLTPGKNPGEVDITETTDTLEHVLASALGIDAVKLIPCGGGDPIAAAREQWNDGSNTLAVRPGRVMVYQRNAVTNDILDRAGVELLEIPSAELSRGRGGPHCMSMAFWRDDL